MKFIYSLLMILSFSSIGYAQHNVDMKAIQEKMKMAQAMIDSLKKTNPMLRNVQVPNVQKMVAANNSKMAKLQSIQAVKQQNLSNALPQRKNVSVTSLSKLTSATLVVLAQRRLAEVQVYLEPDMKKYLDEMAKNTHSNIAGAGILASSFGLPKYVGDYLICKGVLRNPTNMSAINDLGISFRQSHQYKEAVQCFLYALQFENSSMVLNTNAGWASAYYGDLNAAKNYFQQAINAKQDLSPAMEGLATVNYQLGDSGSLKNCLKQELMFLSAGGAGPSMEFASVCGGVMDPDFQVSYDHQNDPDAEHTFDHPGGDEENQDEPPGADEEDVTYPSFKPMFIGDAKDLFKPIKLVVPSKKKGLDEVQRGLRLLKANTESLPPLTPPPYVDEQGNTIVPHTPVKFYNLFHYTHMLFQRRVFKYKKKYNEELKVLLKNIPQHDQDMVDHYFKAIQHCVDQYDMEIRACGDNSKCLALAEKHKKQCLDDVDCQWIPIMHGSKNSDLDGLIQIWKKYFDHLVEIIKWYKEASSPFISRVHEVAWNKHMNLIRQWDVRIAILDSYDGWFDGLIGVNNGGAIATYIQKELNCHTDMPTMDDAPDPFSKKPGKLKTFAGPCYTEPTEIDLKVVKYEDNCDHTKIAVGDGPFMFYGEKVYSRKFKEDDYYQAGMTIGMSGKVGYEEGTEGWKGSAEAELSAEADVFQRWNSDFERTEKGYSVEVTGKLSGGVETGVGPVDAVNPIETELSVSAKIEAITGMNGQTHYTLSAKKN